MKKYFAFEFAHRGTIAYIEDADLFAFCVIEALDKKGKDYVRS